MAIRSAFREPNPVEIRVQSPVSRNEFAAAIARALAERRYSNPRGDDLFMRLRDGSASPDNARFTVKTYVMPGVQAGANIDKLVTGSFHDTATGSELVAQVSVPISRRSIWLLIGWAAVVTLLFAGFAGFGTFSRAMEMGHESALLFGLAAAVLALVAAGIVIFAPLAVLWWLMLRYNQRANLRQVGSLARFLEAIGKDAESLSPQRSPRDNAAVGSQLHSPA